MSKPDQEALRQALWDTLQAVKSGTTDHATARSVCEVAGKLHESVRLEIDYLRVTGQTEGSGFVTTQKQPDNNRPAIEKTSSGETSIAVVPGGRIVQHRMR